MLSVMKKMWIQFYEFVPFLQFLLEVIACVFVLDTVEIIIK